MEIGSVASQALQSTLADTAGGASPAKPAGEASPDAVAALDRAVEAGGAPGQSAAQSPVPDEAQPVKIEAPAAGERTLGDRILNGLGQMNQDAKTAIDNVQQIGATGDPSAADLLRAQYDLMRVSIQQDVTAKVVGKATQTVDTFLKNQ